MCQRIPTYNRERDNFWLEISIYRLRKLDCGHKSRSIISASRKRFVTNHRSSSSFSRSREFMPSVSSAPSLWKFNEASRYFDMSLMSSMEISWEYIRLYCENRSVETYVMTYASSYDYFKVDIARKWRFLRNL